MLQSTSKMRAPSGLHVAIIMDGNGRWAAARGLPRLAGHRRGASAVRRVVEAAPALGIGTLTLYAFSADNWKRPHHEVRGLMTLFRTYLDREMPALVRDGVRLTVIGRRDRVGPGVLAAVVGVEAATAAGQAFGLRIAIDYSARDAILDAARRLDGRATREDFAGRLGEAYGEPHGALDVDLLIRTGGEQRLSDFLLWECAYAELYFTDRMWPEFTGRDLAAAVREFSTRQRRFGGLAGLPRPAEGRLSRSPPASARQVESRHFFKKALI
jgi:undecaprenyl diphosphate synthase